jgi:hypothetical protein
MLWTATVVARADLFVLRIDEESLQSLAAALSTSRSSRTRLATAQHERVARLPDLRRPRSNATNVAPIVSARSKFFSSLNSRADPSCRGVAPHTGRLSPFAVGKISKADELLGLSPVREVPCLR